MLWTSCKDEGSSPQTQTAFQLLTTPSSWEVVVAKNIQRDTVITELFRQYVLTNLRFRSDSTANAYMGTKDLGTLRFWLSTDAKTIYNEAQDTMAIVQLTTQTLILNISTDKGRPEETRTRVEMKAMP